VTAVNQLLSYHLTNLITVALNHDAELNTDSDISNINADNLS